MSEGFCACSGCKSSPELRWKWNACSVPCEGNEHGSDRNIQIFAWYLLGFPSSLNLDTTIFHADEYGHLILSALWTSLLSNYCGSCYLTLSTFPWFPFWRSLSTRSCIECTRLFRSQDIYFNLSQVFLPVHLILQGCLLCIQEPIFTLKEKYKRMYNTTRLTNIFIYSVSPRVEVLHTRNHEVPIFHLCCGLPRLCCPVSDHRRCYYWRAEHRNSG